MAHLWRRSLLTRVLAGVLAFFFAGCGASQIDNAPDGSTLSFNPESWDIQVSGPTCSAIFNRRSFIVTLRNADNAPLNDVPVTLTSYNPAFPLIDPSGNILTPDLFGATFYTVDTDSNGNVIARVAMADCVTEDDIFATSGVALGSGRIEIADAASSTNTPPTADGTADSTSGAAPLTVNFDGSGSSDSDGTIVSYLWDFDDGGASSTTATASHTFTTAGTYNVTLTVTDDDGDSDTVTIVITVT